MAVITRWRHDARYLDRMLRRKRLLTAIVHGSGLYRALDAMWAPNRWIEVTRHRVTAPVARPIRIAQVSDLHVVRPGARERRVLELLARERPDAIVLTGDFNALGGAPDAFVPVVAAMQAPLGVWATLGNWDYGHPVDDWAATLEHAGVRLLRNRAAPLVDRVWLAGLDDPLVGHPDPDAAVRDVPAGAFIVALVHGPVVFDDIAGRFPLVLAGHTHGGQIRIPGLPPLYMPRGCRPYVDGWYSRAGSRMYVSRGIGAPGFPVRMFCAPEIAVFELT